MIFKSQNIEFLFVRYFAGECTVDEREFVLSSIEKDSRLKNKFEAIAKIWAYSESSELVDAYLFDADAAWKAVEIQIADSQPQKEDIPLSRPKKIKLHYQLARVAAVLLIGVVLAYFFYPSTEFQTLASLDQSKVVQVLPDHSSITLNKNATIKYPKKFGTNERKVYLWGEAFFEITPDLKKPFVIELGDACVKVVGTAFNVKNIPEQGVVEVTVYSGKVLLCNVDKNNQVLGQIALTKGEQGTFNRNTKVLLKTENTDRNNLSWKTGVLSFHEETFDHVLSEIEKFYAVKFYIADKDLLQLKLNATFENESLDSVLEVLKLVHHVDFIPTSGGYFVKKSRG